MDGRDLGCAPAESLVAIALIGLGLKSHHGGDSGATDGWPTLHMAGAARNTSNQRVEGGAEGRTFSVRIFDCFWK